MSILSPVRQLLFVTVTLVLLATLSSAAWAVNIEAFAGFDNTMKANLWSPVGVKLTNPGGRTIEGVLGIEQDAPNRRTMPLCSARVSLPGNSTKLYYVYTRRQEYGGSMKVILKHGNRVVAAKELAPVTVGQHDKLVVSLGDRSSRLSFLSGERIPLAMNMKRAVPPGYSSGGATDSTIQTAAISPLMLPDRPAAYQAADMLIVSDLGGMAVDPKSLKAISMWVAGGGTLVVSTGPNFRSFQTEFFDDLLPVTITGAASVPTLGAIGSIGKAAFPAGPVAVATSTPKPVVCTQILREGGVPIYAERRYGAGRVIFLAFDYKASPFRDWNGQTEFWKSLVMTSSSAVMVPENLEWMQSNNYHLRYNPGSSGSASGLSAVVEQNPAVRTPSFNIIALYLLAYVVFLVPLNYLYLKKKRRMELAWISTPAIVLFFTFGAYAIGYTMKGGKIEMGVATVIEGSTSSRYARVINNASVFSPSRRAYNVEINDPFAIGQIVPQESSESMPAAYVGEKTTIEDVDMAMWSSKAIESLSGIDLGGVVVSNLRLAGSRIDGTITNNTSLDLQDCHVQFGGNQQFVGDLPKGRTVKVNALKMPGSSGVLNKYGSYATDIRTRLQGLANTSASAAGTPVLIGFAKQHSAYGLANHRTKITSLTCCMFRLDVAMGSARVFSSDMIASYVTQMQNAHVMDEGGSNGWTMNISPGGFFVVGYQLPVSGSFELTGLSLRHTAIYQGNGSAGRKTRCSFATVDRNWEKVSVHDGGDVPNPGKYLQPGNRIMIKVESLDSVEIAVSVGISAAGRGK